jgi:aspartokinase-like uncharacterized kinase
VDVVIKIGGGLLREHGALDRIADTLEGVVRLRRVSSFGRPVTSSRVPSPESRVPSLESRLLIVPGGGPFADLVRQVAHGLSLTDDAAHWMALLAMDQCAHLLASRITGSAVVHNIAEARAAVDDSLIPVLAPYAWLREADPLPHSWDVTSDSIAAWIAGELDARHLILVKPVGGEVAQLVDHAFARIISPAIDCDIADARNPGSLRDLLVAGARARTS